MPLEWAAELARRGLDRAVAEARVQHHRLDVTVEPDATVHVRLDVLVQVVGARLAGQDGQVRQQLRATHVDGLERGVGEQNVDRSTTFGRSRRCAEPKRMAPPYGSSRRFQAP